MELKKKAVKSVKWVGVSSFFISILQFIQILVLAKYLDPTDFGVMALALMVVGFCSQFMDAGISAAIIHKQSLTHVQLSSLYWLNMFAATILCLIVYFSSVYISNFYEESELKGLIQTISIYFLLTSVGSLYRILNQKELLLELNSKIEIISGICSFIVAIVSAINGFGVYSLVYAYLTNAFISSVLFLVLGIKKFTPKIIYVHKDINDVINFGLFQMGERILNYINSQIDVILIGKLFGSEVLGIYSMAKNLAMKPTQLISPVILKVTFPLLAKLQNDTNRLKDTYHRVINILCTINFPIYILISMTSETIVLLLLGEKWLGVAAILQMLSIYYMLRSIGNLTGSLQLAKGRADLGFYWNLIIFIFFPFFVFLGSFFGIVGIVSSIIILQFIIIIPHWYFMIRALCNSNLKDYLNQILRPLGLFLVSMIFPLIIDYIIESNRLIEDLLLTTTSLLIYLYLTIKFNPSLYSFVKEFLLGGAST